MTTFAEYQTNSNRTNHGEPPIGDIGYLALALVGEAGELANEVKKHYRDDFPNGGGEDMFQGRRQRTLLELGDMLWYMSRIAEKLGSSLDEVAAMNVEKLRQRHLQHLIAGNEGPSTPSPSTHEGDE